ncbi:MAG TPA: hypothetical protein VG870_14890 [Chitinophagaceae bacterium]|nr:hypothetical protein [Chitinophagaceae bacterium]
MKKILFTLLAGLPLACLSQTKTIYDTAAEKMCEYLQAHPDQPIKSEQDAQALFAQAFLDACMPYVDRLLQAEGLSTFDEESGHKIGYKIGLKLAVMCPAYIKILQPVVKGQMTNSSSEETGTLDGTVTGIVQDDYTYLQVRLPDGSTRRLLWLAYFDQAENINNDPQQLVGKKVEFNWKMIRLYYRKSHSFSAEKMVTGMKLP